MHLYIVKESFNHAIVNCMQIKFLRVLAIGFVFIFCLIPTSVSARCSTGEAFNMLLGTPVGQGSFKIPVINITSSHLQPIGSVINSNTINPMDAFYTWSHVDHKTSDEALYWCNTAQEAAQMNVYFATNGSNPLAGGEIVPGFPGVYYNFIKYVGTKISIANNGQTATPYWQSMSVKPKYNSERNRYEYTMADLSPVHIDIVRIATTAPKGQQHAEGIYTDQSPLLLFGFFIPGLGSALPIQPNTVSGYKNGYYSNVISFGLSVNPTTRVYNTASCIISNHTPVVNFAPLTVQSLNAGGSRTANVSITLECDSAIVDTQGVSNGQTAIGLRIPAASFNKSVELGLSSFSYQSVEYLISDNYDRSDTAKGVGVRLQNTGNGQAMRFIGWSGFCSTVNNRECYANTVGGGSEAGWYNVLDGAKAIQINDDATKLYQLNLLATFEKIHNLNVTPGHYKATAEILVRVQ